MLTDMWLWVNCDCEHYKGVKGGCYCRKGGLLFGSVGLRRMLLVSGQQISVLMTHQDAWEWQSVCIKQKDKDVVLRRERSTLLLPFRMAQPSQTQWLESLNHLNVIIK